MNETKAERLADSLNAFIQSSPDVEAAAVISFDGLAMASALPDGMDEDRVGAMSAALLSLGEQAAHGLGRGEMHQLFVEGEHGFVFLMSARGQAVLAAVTNHTAKIGFILFEMRRAADSIGAVLGGNDEVPASQPEAADPVQHEAPAPQPYEPTHVAGENGDPYYVVAGSQMTSYGEWQ
ncbi:MAG: roadblock/LC7 domain-containing protein [Egibacteraceae bacterium]